MASGPPPAAKSIHLQRPARVRRAGFLESESLPNRGVPMTSRASTERVRTLWLFLVNLALVLLLIGAVAAPAAYAAGLPRYADFIHTAYLPLCPQRPSHSYFVFGYQTALEHREIAMLGALLVGGLIYGRVRERASPLPFWVLLVAGLPIGWDVLTQMLELRESDWFTRTWTGALSCLAYVFWLYPRFDRSLRPTFRAAPGGSAARRQARDAR